MNRLVLRSYRASRLSGKKIRECIKKNKISTKAPPPLCSNTSVTCLSSFYQIHLSPFRVKVLLNVYGKDNVGIETDNPLSLNYNGVSPSETRKKTRLNQTLN